MSDCVWHFKISAKGEWDLWLRSPINFFAVYAMSALVLGPSSCTAFWRSILWAQFYLGFWKENEGVFKKYMQGKVMKTKVKEALIPQPFLCTLSAGSLPHLWTGPCFAWLSFFLLTYLERPFLLPFTSHIKQILAFLVPSLWCWAVTLYSSWITGLCFCILCASFCAWA